MTRSAGAAKRAAGALTALAGLVLIAGAQAAQQNPPAPACDPATVPAVRFDGLPERIPFGKTEEYGIADDLAAPNRVLGPVALNVINQGKSIYKDRTTVRGDDLYLLTLYIFGGHASVELEYTERSPEAQLCVRKLGRRVVGFKDGKRFQGWVEVAGRPRPRHSFPAGASLSFVFTDRFSYGTPYRLCWQRLSGRDRHCRRQRTGVERKPSSLFAPAPPPGSWQANWRVGGRIVTAWRFRVG
jgi:hypothetical protein